MINHLQLILKPGRTNMRLASTCACFLLVSACAPSLRQSADEGRPTAVVQFSAAPAASKKPHTFADCLDESLAAAPDLAPSLAEKCCGIEDLEPGEAKWCRRRLSNTPVSLDGEGGYIRWVHESSYCQLLDSLRRQDAVYEVSLHEIEIQCRLANIMGRKANK